MDNSDGSDLLAEAVDRSRNMEYPGTFRNIPPEHPGTSNNYDNYEKKCKFKFWTCSRDHLERSDWSRDIMFLFAGRKTFLPNEYVRKNFPSCEIN